MESTDDLTERVAASSVGEPLEYSVQPAESRMTCERHPGGGVTLAFRPAGLGEERLGVVGILLAMVVVTLITARAILENPQRAVAIVVLLTLVWAGVIALVVAHVKHGRLPTVLVVSDGKLIVIAPGEKGSRRREWPREWVRSIVATPVGTGGDLNQLGVLTIDRPDGETQVLKDHHLAEVRWVARVLRDALYDGLRDALGAETR